MEFGRSQYPISQEDRIQLENALMKFGKTQCPISQEERIWLENALEWLGQEFGRETLRHAEVILPEPQYFPDIYDGSPASLRKLVDHVCRYMHIEPERIAFEIYTDKGQIDLSSLSLTGPERTFQAAGVYHGSYLGVYTIGLEASRVKESVSLVATIAHELGHVHLIDGEHLSPQQADHELLTDLLTVFFGLGIFSANAAFEFKRSETPGLAGWHSSRLGYLTEPMYGYALALFAAWRHEAEPPWARYLDPSVQAYFQQSCRYLHDVGLGCSTEGETWQRPETVPAKSSHVSKSWTAPLKTWPDRAKNVFNKGLDQIERYWRLMLGLLVIIGILGYAINSSSSVKITNITRSQINKDTCQVTFAAINRSEKASRIQFNVYLLHEYKEIVNENGDEIKLENILGRESLTVTFQPHQTQTLTADVKFLGTPLMPVSKVRVVAGKLTNL